MQAGSGLLLLAFAGLAAVHVLLLVSTAGGPRSGAATSALAAAPEGAPARTPATSTPTREPVLGLGCPTGSGEAAEAPEAGESAAREAKKPRGARKEREFLTGFLAMVREQPGELEARAEAVLAGDGPRAEKVALLRALEQSGSKERLRWLEHAVRTQPDDSGPDGVSVASFALGELVAAARAEHEARPVLWCLAFETRGLEPGLRRNAAVGYARCANDLELDGLRVALAREDDELLAAGVLAALRERTECPRAARLLVEFSPQQASATIAPEE